MKRTRLLPTLTLAAALGIGCAPAATPAPLREEARPETSALARSGPRAARVLRDGAVILEITEGPGVLIDTNAPPPPPGVVAARNGLVGATCGGGKPALCSEARDLLLASSSYDEFLTKLRSAGFVVEAR
jgi:hypothetical protein